MGMDFSDWRIAPNQSQKWYAFVEATISDRGTGKKFNVSLNEVEIGSKDEFPCEEDARRWYASQAEDDIFTEIDSDTRFDCYENFDSLECTINKIHISDEKFLKKGSKQEGFLKNLNQVNKSRIVEANDSLTTNVALFLESELSKFEKELPNRVYGKIKGYDPDWCADNYNENYKKVRNAYLDQLQHILFENFNQ